MNLRHFEPVDDDDLAVIQRQIPTQRVDNNEGRDTVQYDWMFLKLTLYAQSCA
jgi:hypothetical protein